MRLRLVTVAGALLASMGLLAPPVEAQTITSYNLVVYDQGGSQPVQQNAITAWTCNLPRQTGSTTNPTRVAWEDPADTTKDCVADQTQFLLSVPIGQTGVKLYDGVLYALGPGGTSPGSNRAPFERRAEAPATPTGLKIIR